MEFKRFIIPSSFYPRYFYFHQRLRRFVPKFQDIVGKNDFAKCILFGEKQMEDILKAFNQFLEKVEVFVGKDDAIIEEVTWKELIVEDNSMDDGAVLESAAPRPSGASCGSQICVVLVNNATIEEWQNSSSEEKGLIFFNTDDSHNMTEKTKLNKLIQAELETRVILLFESVYSFINKLIPRGCKEFSDLTQHTCSMDKSKVKEAIHEVVREYANKEPEKKDISAFICDIKTVVIKKTRATFCEDISKACCLPQAVILDFQGENFFDVEKKIMELEIHNLIDVNSSDETKLMKELVSFMVQGLQDIELTFVKFMKEQIVSISMLSRKQFELTGIFRSTNVKIDVLLPTILKIPRELQHKLLQNHPDVSGCGHRHGKFVIDIKKALDEKDKEKIIHEMKEYSFNFGFNSEVIRFVKQAGFCVEQGYNIRAQKTPKTHHDPPSYNYGSLGCFMQKEEIDSQGLLLGITCGHCVSGCDKSIEVCIDLENEFKPLGKVQYNSAPNYPEDEFLDIAAIEITLNENYVKKELKRSDGRYAKTWDVFDGELPIGSQVYKHTCQKIYDENKESSEMTLGTIISSEYMENPVKEKITQLEVSCKTFHQLPGPYIVHIEPENISEEPFSVKGDSGAVVCADDMDSVQNVHVIALLTGAIEKRSTDGSLEYIHSKGSVFHKLLSVVKIQADMKLLPACAKLNAGGSEAAPASTTTTTPSVD